VICREKVVLFRKLEQKTAKKHHMEMTRAENGHLQEELKANYADVEANYKEMKSEVQEL
jgi:hypothetical protein